MARRKKNDLDENWKQISGGVHSIYSSQPISNEKRMDLYTKVYDSCVSSSQIASNNFLGRTIGKSRLRTQALDDTNIESPTFGASTRILDKLDTLLEEILQARTDALKINTGVQLLQAYQIAWSEFTAHSQIVNGIFGYVNRKWNDDGDGDGGPRHKEGEDANIHVYELAIISWKKIVFEAVKEALILSTLTEYESHRQGRVHNAILTKQIIDSCISLGLTTTSENAKKSLSKRSQEKFHLLKDTKTGLVLSQFIYNELIEKPIFTMTREYFSTLADRFYAENPNATGDYMRMIENELAREEPMVTFYLPHKSFRPIITICEDVLIRMHLQEILIEFKGLINEDKIQDLAKAYSLVSRLDNALPELHGVFQEHTTEMGQNAIQGLGAEVEPKQFVTSILAVHSQYSKIISDSFHSDPGFTAALDKACSEFINNNVVTQSSPNAESNTSKSAELLAKYCDIVLRKSLVSDIDEERLDKIVQVFKYLSDKDAFQAHYCTRLASRLVSQNSSDYAEQMMLDKLKLANGYEYVAKFTRMFTDIRVSHDLHMEFKQSMIEKEVELRHDFYANILTSQIWPLKPVSNEFALPEELSGDIQKYTEFYSLKYGNRKLNWHFHRGKGELIANCFGKRILCLSTFQMSILLMYNQADSYQLGEIVEATKLKPELALQTLESLAKSKLIIGELPVAGQEPDLGAQFQLNMDYKSDKRRVNVNVPSSSRGDKTAAETNKTAQDLIDKGRSEAVQACIVRIMKMNKRLKHNKLVGMVMEGLKERFQVEGAFVKKHIDLLIGKDYLERSEEDQDTYDYIA